MQNKSYHSANRVTLIAPAGGVVGGTFRKIGALFGSVVASQKEGGRYTLDREGIWGVKVESQGAPVAVGDQIFWESGRADAEFSNQATAGAVLVGVACGAVANGQTAVIDVAITPMPLTIAAEALEDAGGADA